LDRFRADSIQKIGLNIMLSLPVKKLDAFKFDGVAEYDNTAQGGTQEVRNSTSQIYFENGV